MGKSYLAQTLVQAVCRHNDTARYWRLDDLENQLAVQPYSDPARLKLLGEFHSCDLLVLDDLLTTPITSEGGIPWGGVIPGSCVLS